MNLFIVISCFSSWTSARRFNLADSNQVFLKLKLLSVQLNFVVQCLALVLWYIPSYTVAMLQLDFNCIVTAVLPRKVLIRLLIKKHTITIGTGIMYR